jgi:hypothetical protein
VDQSFSAVDVIDRQIVRHRLTSTAAPDRHGLQLSIAVSINGNQGAVGAA